MVKVDRKMGSRNVFEPGPDARRVWQVSLPTLSQALLPLPLGFGSMLQWVWQLWAFPLASKAFIPVMMMACQGHRPRTKQGCSRLISNVTGATSRRGCLFRLRSVTSRSKMFPSLCVADIKSSIFVFSFSWVIGNASCLLPCMSDQATQFLLPSSGPGMSLFPLFVYLNPTCLKDWPPPWSLHSRMHGTPVFVSQVGALISPCTGFCFLCLTVPGCSGHREWWQIHWMKHNEGCRKSRDLGIQRPGFVTLDKSLPVSGFQSLSVKWELNRIISKVHSRSKVLGLIVD